MHPILLHIGPLTVYSYGVMVALGTLIASFFCQRHALKVGLSDEKIIDLIFWALIWGLIGARLFYVLLNFGDYLKFPLDIVKIYKGGLVFHGGLILGFISGIVFIKRNKLPFLKTIDLIFLYLPLAHAFGRIGCFLNGCCYGKPTLLFFGVIFPGHPLCVHPTQLYSSFLLICIFFALLKISRNKKFSGQIFSAYCIFYGAVRFCVEILRVNPRVLWNFSYFQILSALMFFGGLFLYFYFKRMGKID
ncbi:MAG: prolipoprotein diacylglyceryl transferase [Candidatus Omnitrophota bacterium]|nr:MAG: prolipoprotein diacylglyceryl transferase [Candidatus Omnitrophota bacterium]